MAMTREEYDSEEEKSPQKVPEMKQQYDSRNQPTFLSGKASTAKSSLTSKLFKGMSKGFKLAR